MKKHSTLLIVLSMCLLAACTDSGKYEYPFQNPSLTPEKRADNLLSLLTVGEKIYMLVAEGFYGGSSRDCDLTALDLIVK